MAHRILRSGKDIDLPQSGLDTLVKSAVHGRGHMPARGGAPDLSDREIEGAIVYMFNYGVAMPQPTPLRREDTDGHTRKICERLRELIEPRGAQVEVGSIQTVRAEDLQQFDKIVVGASIRYGRHNPRVVEFVNANARALHAKPSAFFSVNLVARIRGRSWSSPTGAASRRSLSASPRCDRFTRPLWRQRQGAGLRLLKRRERAMPSMQWIVDAKALFPDASALQGIAVTGRRAKDSIMKTDAQLKKDVTAELEWAPSRRAY